MEKGRETGAGVGKEIFVSPGKEKTGWGTTEVFKYLHWQKRRDCSS